MCLLGQTHRKHFIGKSHLPLPKTTIYTDYLLYISPCEENNAYREKGN